MTDNQIMCDFCESDTTGTYRVTAGGYVVCAERCETGSCINCGEQTSREVELCAPCRIDRYERSLLPPDQWGRDGTPWDADDPTVSVGQGLAAEVQP